MLTPLKHQGYSSDGRRTYYKGGGGDAGADSRRMEADRQGRISAATESINAIFNNKVQKSRVVPGRKVDMFGGQIETPGTTETYYENGDPANSRDLLYSDQRKAVYDLNSQEVNRQATEASRDNRFGLARSGLAGGSADVDSVTEINRRTNEGLLRAGGIADQSAADLKTSDERTRSNLISMAQSGIDTGSASTMALNGLKVNAENVAAQRSGSTVGGLFNDMSQAYLMNQVNQGRAAGTNTAGQWYGVSSPSQKYAGT